MASDEIRARLIPKDPPATQTHLGDLAVRLFGTVAGIDLDLPRHPPHEALNLGNDWSETGKARYS